MGMSDKWVDKMQENIWDSTMKDDLAFRSGVLAQERGNSTRFGDLFRKRALHVFDGWVSSAVEEELYDISKLAGWRWETERKY